LNALDDCGVKRPVVLRAFEFIAQTFQHVQSRAQIGRCIMTPLAKDEFTGPRGEAYRRMIEGSVANGPASRTKSVPSMRC
jgi:hypothetical protein